MMGQALASCLYLAAQTYSVPVEVLFGILRVEGGRIGQQVGNKNGTYDLGPMQINTIWIPQLAKGWGISERLAQRFVRDDLCVNVSVGAWILRQQINKTGHLSKGIAHYHSATPHLGKAYLSRVIDRLRRMAYVDNGKSSNNKR